MPPKNDVGEYVHYNKGLCIWVASVVAYAVTIVTVGVLKLFGVC
jgi:hypothetical protein